MYAYAYTPLSANVFFSRRAVNSKNLQRNARVHISKLYSGGGGNALKRASRTSFRKTQTQSARACSGSFLYRVRERHFPPTSLFDFTAIFVLELSSRSEVRWSRGPIDSLAFVCHGKKGGGSLKKMRPRICENRAELLGTERAHSLLRLFQELFGRYFGWNSSFRKFR